MYTENQGRLPLLDVLVHHRGDGTLGHKVYRKPTHMDLYLHAFTCNHLAHKRSVLSTLVYLAWAISDEQFLQG